MLSAAGPWNWQSDREDAGRPGHPHVFPTRPEDGAALPAILRDVLAPLPADISGVGLHAHRKVCS